MHTATSYRPLLVATTVVCAAAVLVSLATAQPRRAKLSGAEVHEQLLARYSAFAGVNHELNCVFLIVTHSPTRREQYWNCTVEKGYLTERVLDHAILDTDLSPVEQAARAWRDDVIADLGGVKTITTTKMALLNASVDSMSILSSIDRYLFELAGADGLASRKHRRLFPVVEQRMRIADSLARQLQALGLDRAAPPVQSLHEYLAQRSASEPSPVTPDDGEVSGQ